MANPEAHPEARPGADRGAHPVAATDSLPAWRSGAWFLATGGAAALTHTGLFELTRHWILPELANAVGFAVAFWVSFAGHRWGSFSDSGLPLGQSLRRFAVTALAGFAANEGVFVLLLRVAGLPPLASLLGALLAAAAQTFLLGRFWAFRR